MNHPDPAIQLRSMTTESLEIVARMQAHYEAELEHYRKALDMLGKFIRFLTDEQPESDDKFNAIHAAKSWSYYTDHGRASELLQQTIPNTVDIAMLARWGWRALRDKPQPGRENV